MWKIAEKEVKSSSHCEITSKIKNVGEENLLFIVISVGDNRKMLASSLLFLHTRHFPTKEISFLSTLGRKENFAM